MARTTFSSNITVPGHGLMTLPSKLKETAKTHTAAHPDAGVVLVETVPVGQRFLCLPHFHRIIIYEGLQLQPAPLQR